MEQFIKDTFSRVLVIVISFLIIMVILNIRQTYEEKEHNHEKGGGCGCGGKCGGGASKVKAQDYVGLSNTIQLF